MTMPFTTKPGSNLIYDNGIPIALATTEAYARQIVDAVNDLRQLLDDNAILDHENVDLHKEVARLRAAVANMAGDNLCWMDNTTAKIPPRDQFLESCARYHAQIAESRGVIPAIAGCMTIAQLEAENARLRAIIDKLKADKSEVF